MDVSTLEGRELDAAVARAEGYHLDSDGDNLSVRESGGAPSAWHPSTDWAQGGPIIDRERIAIAHWEHDDREPGQPAHWRAEVGLDGSSYFSSYSFSNGAGPTPLIAAMRAYLASKAS